MNEHSWAHRDLEMSTSEIHGSGVFAKQDIPKNTVVLVWGGKILTTDEIKKGKGISHTTVAISKDLWLSALSEEEKSIDDFVNHSCNPNIGMLNEIALITMNDVKKGDELTADYCIWIIDNDYKMNRPCKCGSENCRTQITGSDWQLVEVQKHLMPYFSPLLKKRLMPY